MVSVRHVINSRTKKNHLFLLMFRAVAMPDTGIVSSTQLSLQGVTHCIEESDIIENGAGMEKTKM